MPAADGSSRNSSSRRLSVKAASDADALSAADEECWELTGWQEEPSVPDNARLASAKLSKYKPATKPESLSAQSSSSKNLTSNNSSKAMGSPGRNVSSALSRNSSAVGSPDRRRTSKGSMLSGATAAGVGSSSPVRPSQQQRLLGQQQQQQTQRCMKQWHRTAGPGGEEETADDAAVAEHFRPAAAAATGIASSGMMGHYQQQLQPGDALALATADAQATAERSMLSVQQEQSITSSSNSSRNSSAHKQEQQQQPLEGDAIMQGILNRLAVAPGGSSSTGNISSSRSSKALRPTMSFGKSSSSSSYPTATHDPQLAAAVTAVVDCLDHQAVDTAAAADMGSYSSSRHHSNSNSSDGHGIIVGLASPRGLAAAAAAAARGFGTSSSSSSSRVVSSSTVGALNSSMASLQNKLLPEQPAAHSNPQVPSALDRSASPSGVSSSASSSTAGVRSPLTPGGFAAGAGQLGISGSNFSALGSTGSSSGFGGHSNRLVTPGLAARAQMLLTRDLTTSITPRTPRARMTQAALLGGPEGLGLNPAADAAGLARFQSATLTSSPASRPLSSSANRGPQLVGARCSDYADAQPSMSAAAAEAAARRSSVDELLQMINDQSRASRSSTPIMPVRPNSPLAVGSPGKAASLAIGPLDGVKNMIGGALRPKSGPVISGVSINGRAGPPNAAAAAAAAARRSGLQLVGNSPAGTVG